MLGHRNFDLRTGAGDYHAHTDTREHMQQRVDEGSAASSTRSPQPSAAAALPEAESSDSMEEVCICRQHAAVLTLTNSFSSSDCVVTSTFIVPHLEIVFFQCQQLQPSCPLQCIYNNSGVQDMFKEDLPAPSTTTSVDSLQTGPPQHLNLSSSDRSQDGVSATQSNSTSSALIVPPSAQLLLPAPAASSGPVTERACALVS